MSGFSHRASYINFAEHLQNAWNPNMYFPGAPNEWSVEDWGSYFKMIKAFGFNIFEFWLVPTLFDRPALEGGEAQKKFAENMRNIIKVAHENGIKVKTICSTNTVGPEWYFACLNDPEDRKLSYDLWEHWMKELEGIDYVGIFPGDPGGCNRNGCTYKTYIDYAIELMHNVVLKHHPDAICTLGTWGTPFSGWDKDLHEVPNWDGSWGMLIDPLYATPEIPCHIWNGDKTRAKEAMEYLISKLPEFPENAIIEINLGFSPDATHIMGGNAKKWAREIAKQRDIVTWDYSLAEGELINYPHWRLPRMSMKMREWKATAPYIGGMSYTMTPKLNLLSQYVAGQILSDTNTCPDTASCDFCEKVFGKENRILGELFEAFEVVNGWGHHPRHDWSKADLIEAYDEIIERLEKADMSKCELPLFPDPETHRQDLLWFAKEFRKLAGDNPDREAIKKEYWDKSLAIYNVIPMSADERADLAATNFSKILEDNEPKLSWVDLLPEEEK